MSSFTTQLKLSPADDEPGVWVLQRGFTYDLGYRGGSDKIKVPKGFRTNFASVPKFAQIIYSPYHPSYGKAAVLHDYLWSIQKYSKKYCDAVFYDAMISLKCPAKRREMFYQAVNLFGNAAWKNSQIEAIKKDPAIELQYPVLVNVEERARAELAAA